MMKVAILGASGRMGQTLVRCLLTGRVPELELAAAVDIETCPVLGQDAGELAGVGPAGISLSGDPSVANAADVWIDFTFHTATAAHAQLAVAAGKPLVIGTTGLTDEERAAVADAAKQIPVVMAPNMSLGVNLLCALVEDAASALKGRGYDIEIVERHHRRKKDAPSGTALALGEAAARGAEVDLGECAVHGRSGVSDNERTATEIGFHAVRAGDIVGDHTVTFATDGEMVELGHRATNRDTFAVGALRAAAWLVGRPAGLHTMRDVLGL